MSDEVKRTAGKKRRNEVLLDDFEADLKAQGLSYREFTAHRKNAAHFLNRYLTEEMDEVMEKGPEYIGKYFRKFYPACGRNPCPDDVRAAAESLRLFYRCMQEEDYISGAELTKLERRIRFSMPVWVRCCTRESGRNAGPGRGGDRKGKGAGHAEKPGTGKPGTGKNRGRQGKRMRP